MRRTIRPTANARLPRAICASLGRTGAPPDAPRSNSPMPSDSSSRNSLASTTARTGITMKFATSDSVTSRRLRSGAAMSATRRPRPIPIMLERTNTIVQVERAACFRSMGFSSVPDAYQKLTAPDTNGISLVRGAIVELLEDPDAGIESVMRKDQVRHEPQGIDGVALAGLLGGDRRSRLRR